MQRLILLPVGVNDLKDQFSRSPEQVAGSVGKLIQLVMDSDAGPSGTPPAVFVLTPPACKENEHNKDWGMTKIAERSAELGAKLREVATALGAQFVDVSLVPVGTDGVHYDVKGHYEIATLMAEAISGHFGWDQNPPAPPSKPGTESNSTK